MQRIYNYGSLLQAYGLKQLIKSIDSSVEVSFLDYKPGTPLEEVPEETNSRVFRTINKVKQYSKGKAPLNSKIKFLNHKRTYEIKNYPYLDISQELNHDTNIDLEIIGSDEVFNCVQGNTNVGYSKDLFGYNSQANRLISYAASFGNTTFEKLKDKGIEIEVSKMFNNFDEISVRDQNSSDIIEKLAGIKPEINVDPAIAYDYMNLEEKIPKEKLFNDKYIVLYGYSGRFTEKENRLIKEYSDKHSYKILCFGGVQDCCDEFVDCSPFELLAYFRDAEAIITDTFHGTIFSIINNKQFCSVIRRSHGNSYGNEEKLSYLLNMFGLDNQKIFSGDKMDFSEVLNKTIDYQRVNLLIDEQRSKSKDYLKRNLT